MKCEFTQKDIEWVKKCLVDNDKYKIVIDNDLVEVWDINNTESFYTFSHFGKDFYINVLLYFGLSVDFT